jgi:hypothetical protein
MKRCLICDKTLTPYNKSNLCNYHLTLKKHKEYKSQKKLKIP